MKAKTNLELFKNEIVHGLKHGRYDTLYAAMVDIYERETGGGSINYDKVLDWFLGIPRETFEVTPEMYAFLKAYANSEMVRADAPLDFSVSTSILIDIGVIPERYSKWSLKDFSKIITVEGSSK